MNQLRITRDGRLPVLAETGLLKPSAMSIARARTKPFYVTEFFQNRPGFRLHDLFRSRLNIEKREPVPSTRERIYFASCLKVDASDEEIRLELPKNHLSSLEDIADFVVAQPKGKPGFLLNKNIFYVLGYNGEVFAMQLYRFSGCRGWLGLAWQPGEVGKWRAGIQVLYPGNASL